MKMYSLSKLIYPLTCICYLFHVIQGQAASPDAESCGLMASTCADIGWQIACSSDIPPNPTINKVVSGQGTHHNYSTMSSATATKLSTVETQGLTSRQNYSTYKEREIPGKN